jgi:large subunit ribosomal protein L22
MATKTPTLPYTYRASHEYARISVRKLLPILDLVRGKFADDAVDVLKYMPHRGARMIEKVLKSAMARGEGGPMFKRLMPRARGMAYMIRRRSAHIRITLTDFDALDAAAAKGGDEADRD